MKRSLSGIGLLSSLLLVAGIASAQAEPIFLPEVIDEDLYFDQEVYLPNVELPEDLGEETGESEVTMEGVGTLTLGNRTGGGFPGFTIFGGTTITSERDHGEWANREWWEGELNPLSDGRQPNIDDLDIETLNRNGYKNVEVVGTYQMGRDNETFSFSTPIQIVATVPQVKPNVKIFLAYKQDDGTWEVDDEDYCFSQDGYCIFETDEISSVALVVNRFFTCPIRAIANGEIAGPPFCEVVCYAGYEHNDERNRCVTKGEGVTAGEEGMDSSAPLEPRMYEYRQGYFRMLGTRDQMERELPTEGLSGDDLFMVRKSNAGLREAVGVEEVPVVRDESSSFLNYLLGRRGEEVKDATVKLREGEGGGMMEGELEEGAMMEEGEEEAFSSAPLLPSTGPGVFLGLATLGLGMMVVASRR